jgi:electron transfer flavoprotein beta subunit
MLTLGGKVNAKKTEIKTITADDLDIDKNKLGLAGSPTQVLRSFIPEKKTGGVKVYGELPELVEKIKSTVLDLGFIK